MLFDERLNTMRVTVSLGTIGVPYYRAEAIWLTVNGNCDDVPAWAKTYWEKYPTTTRGGAQHAFALVLDEGALPMGGVEMRLWWPDGQDDRETSRAQGERGWANIPVWANYDPKITPGPYKWFPTGFGDVVNGLGLPYNHHVSVFVVLRRSDTPLPPPPPPPSAEALRVFIAGPLTVGDHDANVQAFIEAADRVVNTGHIPYVPALTHLWNLISWHPREFWLDYGIEWLATCTALLRLPGESEGADREEVYARSMGIPIYHNVSELPVIEPPDVESLFISSIGSSTFD